MCAGYVSRREKIRGAGRSGAGLGEDGAGWGGAGLETGYHAEIFKKRNMAIVNHLLSSESKFDGIPIEFEILSQPWLRQFRNQLVTQPIKKTSWYPNELRKSAGIPIERKGQSKSAGFI